MAGSEKDDGVKVAFGQEFVGERGGGSGEFVPGMRADQRLEFPFGSCRGCRKKPVQHSSQFGGIFRIEQTRYRRFANLDLVGFGIGGMGERIALGRGRLPGLDWAGD